MTAIRCILITLLVFLVLGLGSAAHAVIYKYVDEKGDILFIDDLQRIPEQRRSSAVMVSGAGAAPEPAAAQRTEAVASREAVLPEQHAAHQRHADAFRGRLMISLSGAAAVAALLFITGNIDALRERRQALARIRAALAAGLVVLLAVVHFPDVIGLFRGAGMTVSGALSDIQEKQEERGRKAAETMKTLNKVLDQAERELEQLPDRKNAEADPGR